MYQANRRVYQLLRHGIKVKVAIDKEHEDVYLIDWENVQANHFALAEEVTLRHGSERRPDIVLYINGLAIAVMELKRGSVNVNDAIQQCHPCVCNCCRKGCSTSVYSLIAGVVLSLGLSDARVLRLSDAVELFEKQCMIFYTLHRWRREFLQQTPTWKGLSGWFSPPVPADQLPGELLSRLQGSTLGLRLQRLLVLMQALTTHCCSLSVRVTMDTHKMSRV